MIRTPPEHNTTNPSGQITYRPKQGLYLRDIIKRIEGEEGPPKANPLPTPIAGPVKRLNDLVGALLKACATVEEDSKQQSVAWGGPGYLPQVRTSVIRRLIKENT